MELAPTTKRLAYQSYDEPRGKFYRVELNDRETGASLIHIMQSAAMSGTQVRRRKIHRDFI